MVTVGNEFEQRPYHHEHFFDELPQQEHNTIRVAAISVDGGRTQLRQEDAGAGVHNPSWVETKVGCLQILESSRHTTDPHPDLPRVFKEKAAMKHMVEGLKGTHAPREPVPLEALDTPHQPPGSVRRGEVSSPAPPSYAPKVIKKLVIADIDHAESFGAAVYTKVHGYGLHTFERKAYLSDGDRKLKTIFEDNFRAEQWTPILDFVHAVEYAHEAAQLITVTEEQCWAQYIEFVTLLWQGRPLTVIRRLDKAIVKLDSGKKGTSKEIRDKLDALKSIAAYFRNNHSKMNYPLYRIQGLPISSCHVESLIKQFNMRIKSSEKFWNKTSVKGVLKIKASLLSHDNSWDTFWNDRYDRQVTTKRKYQKSSLKMAA